MLGPGESPSVPDWFQAPGGKGPPHCGVLQLVLPGPLLVPEGRGIPHVMALEGLSTCHTHISQH